ncbi:MAG: ribose-phosphate diphosphokinase [Parcubacteria group bacterium]
MAEPFPLQLFALDASHDLGEAVARTLGEPLAAHEEREFEDGEHKARPLEEVGGRDVYLVQSLHAGPDQSANDKLVRLLFFIATLKDHGAARVTAVAPYLCYARKDRRTKPRDPLSVRYVATLLEAAGADGLVTLDVHNPAAFENAFRGRAVTLTAAPLFVRRFKGAAEERLCVVSPDPGGVKRAQIFREALEAAMGRPVGFGFLEKRRSAGVVSGDLFAGEVDGATVLIVDDLIASGHTIARAAQAMKRAGAARTIALATHGLFMEGAETALATPDIEQVIVTDAVPPFRLGPGALQNKVEILPCGPLLAEAIRRLHRNEPLADLMVN